MVDDMITTAGTITSAIKMVKDHGANDVYVAASHAVFAPPAIERLRDCPFTKLAVTDTVRIGDRLDGIKDKVQVLSVADLLGEAIHRIHHNASVSALFKDDPGTR
jgi:ribose-phosphate pyrophosphokinase